MDISNDLLERFAEMVAEKLAAKMISLLKEQQKEAPPAPAKNNRRVSFKEAREIFGVSKSGYYSNRDKFPAPHRMGKLLFWWSEELEQFAREEMSRNV